MPPVDYNVTSPTPTHTLNQEYDFNMLDTFLRTVTEGALWAVEVSRIGATQPEIMNEYFLKHDSYIIFTGIHKQESDIISSVSGQLQELQKAGSWGYRARFVVVTSVHINVSIQQLAFKILEEMWKYYSVIDVLTVMSVSNFRFNDTLVDSAIPEGNKPEIDIELFSWFPYTSPTQCYSTRRRNPKRLLSDTFSLHFLSSSRLDDHPIDDDDTSFSDFATKELNTDYSKFSLLHLKVVFLILLIGQSFSTLVS